jgi:iron complex outermembrane receptor protein
VAPNRTVYSNAGQALPALKSRQTEVGIKGASDAFEWGVAWFEIVQPQFSDFGACDPSIDGSCTQEVDGIARHRGVELTGAWHGGAWTLRAGAQWLRARREESQTPNVNGMEPTNVPSRTLRVQADHDLAAIPGLNLQAKASYESRRMVLPDNSATIPGYARVDTAVRYTTRISNAQWTWRAGIDNLFDKRAWRESPFEFGHVYLYPLAPRTLRVSLQVEL